MLFCLFCYALACEQIMTATLLVFHMDYYLWCSDWLKLLQWLAAQNHPCTHTAHLSHILVYRVKLPHTSAACFELWIYSRKVIFLLRHSDNLLYTCIVFCVIVLTHTPKKKKTINKWLWVKICLQLQVVVFRFTPIIALPLICMYKVSNTKK